MLIWNLSGSLFLCLKKALDNSIAMFEECDVS